MLSNNIIYFEYTRVEEELREERRKWLPFVIPVVVIAGLAVALYYGRKYREAAKPEVQQVQKAPAAPAADNPIANPIAPAGTDAQPALPTLEESDPSLLEAITALFGSGLDSFIVPKDIVRHIVVTIDNLPRKKTAVQLRPLKPTSGQFVIGEGSETTLGDDNYARYTPLIKLVQNSDARRLSATYKRLYPLFQQAYIDLGYPKGYFNDRLIQVIDHLLETPEVKGPVTLTQPGVYYEFADPALEQRSAGQKLLIRMGPGNAAVVKLKLRELRREVAKRP